MKRLRDLSVDQWFWLRVLWKPDGCWEWGDHRHPNGYGHLRAGERRVYAHRMAWELTHGPIPDGVYVCHRCDNPPCVRPDHLFLGSNSDNISDAVAKARHAGAKQTHCIHGHPYTPENTYRNPRTGWRQCRTCRRLAERESATRRRQNLSPGDSRR